MKELIESTKKARTRTEKQALAAELVSALPQFLIELGDVEQKYNILLRMCIFSEGSKTGGELLIQDTDVHKEYKQKKRLYEAINTAISVLNMYTGEK
jgi:hypothetical protein